MSIVERPRRPAFSRIAWFISAALACLAICGWIAFFVGVHLGVGKPVLFGIMTGVALAMEGTMWAIAAAFGMTVVETRKRIWSWFMGALSR